MKHTVIALAAALSFTTAASAADLTKPSDVDVNAADSVSYAILTTAVTARGMSGGGGAATQTAQFPVGSLRACMALAFAATYANTDAAVSCLDTDGQLQAVYTCGVGRSSVVCSRKF